MRKVPRRSDGHAHANPDAAEKKKKDEDKRLFGKVDGVKAHPFLAAGILGANSNTIRGDLLPMHVGKLKELLQEYKGSDTKKVSFLYGELDATVPFKQNIDTVREWDKEYDSLNLHIMERIGHEASSAFLQVKGR